MAHSGSRKMPTAENTDMCRDDMTLSQAARAQIDRYPGSASRSVSRRAPLATGISLVLVGMACPAGARAQTASAVVDSAALETIVVTARKRDESLAAGPASPTGFTSDSLPPFNIPSFADYPTETPNVSFSYG